jgi:general stress protein YciG
MTFPYWVPLLAQEPKIYVERELAMTNKAGRRGGSGNFAENRERASEAGRKGGRMSGGNFKNDRARASAAGRKGGEHSSGQRGRSS